MGQLKSILSEEWDTRDSYRVLRPNCILFIVNFSFSRRWYCCPWYLPAPFFWLGITSYTCPLFKTKQKSWLNSTRLNKCRCLLWQYWGSSVNFEPSEIEVSIAEGRWIVINEVLEIMYQSKCPDQIRWLKGERHTNTCGWTAWWTIHGSSPVAAFKSW